MSSLTLTTLDALAVPPRVIVHTCAYGGVVRMKDATARDEEKEYKRNGECSAADGWMAYLVEQVGVAVVHADVEW